MPKTDDALIAAARRLHAATLELIPRAGTAYVYAPLDYAFEVHQGFIRRFARGPRDILFVGMNPGPFGMAQTGVPFGQIAAVRDWMGLSGAIGRPRIEHPKRPIEGFGCQRSEVSGERLYGLFAARCGTAESFFQTRFIVNWCPLVFMGESGANLTPDKLPLAVRRDLEAVCDRHLAEVIEILASRLVIGIGGVATAAATRALQGTPAAERPKLATMLHPSPASPAANRGFAAEALKTLQELGALP